MHFTKAFAAAALLFAGFAGSAQTNLGADCGCPAVGSRTTVNVTSLPGASAIAGDPDAYRLTSGGTFATAIVTTEKDAVRLRNIQVPENIPIFVIPITVAF